MKRINEKDLGAFIDEYLNRAQYRHILQPFFRGTVLQISGTFPGPYTVTIQRTGESGSDGSSYQCAPWYIPTVGDVVEMVWKDANTAWVYAPVSSPGTIGLLLGAAGPPATAVGYPAGAVVTDTNGDQWVLRGTTWYPVGGSFHLGSAGPPGSTSYPAGTRAIDTPGIEWVLIGGAWFPINGGDRFHAEVHCSASQNDSNGASVLLNLDTVDADPNGNFNTTTHAYTCPLPGRYFAAGVEFAANFTTGDHFIAIAKNGAVLYGSGDADPTGGGNFRLNVSFIARCAAGDTLSIFTNTPGATVNAVQGGNAVFEYRGKL